MLFRRQRAPDPTVIRASAQEALAKGDYEVAFAVLEEAVRRGPVAGHGETYLQLAGLYALYGVDGLENGQPALRNAVAAEPRLVSDPRYKSLYWEFAAYRGAPLAEVKRGLRDVDELPATVTATGENGTSNWDAVANYHAAAALFAVDGAKSAARRLNAIPDCHLPVYLEWRRWSLVGQCYEVMGQWEEAADAFAKAAELAPELERDAERLSLAGALVELFKTEEALEQLAAIDDERLPQMERAVHRYLQGRAHLDMDNPNLALELLAEAALLDDESAGAAYSVAFATAQALTAVGRPQEATQAFEQALAAVPAEHRAFTQHEAAYALIECDRLADAESLLDEVVSDPSYAHRADALADLADVRLRLGELDSARALAQEALEQGATAAACITLGGIAFEYYRLEEAASWYEQALSASQAGDPFWVAAQQMLADVFNQLGSEYAARVLIHAKAALEHTEPGSEWYLPLRQYLEDAKSQLGGFERVLN